MRGRLFILLTLLVLGFYAAWLYIQLVAPGCLAECAATYREVVAGTAMSPYRYRVLSTGIVYTLGSNPQTDLQISTAYIIGYVILFPLAFLAYYKALRRWLTPLMGLLGVVLLVMYLPVMMRIWGTSLYIPLELLLLSLALAYMRPGWQYALLVIVATLNRETGILLVLAFAAFHFPRRGERRIQGWTLAYAVLWAAIFVGLRLWRGAAVDEVTIASAWAGNTASWHTVEAVTNHLFLAPLYVAVFAAWRWLSADLKRLFIGVALPYLGLLTLFSFWNEVRLLFPLMPFLTVALMTVVDRALRKELLPLQVSSTA